MSHDNLIIFSALLNRSLKRQGLNGSLALATYGDSALVMSGKGGGALRVDAARTQRVRFGLIEGKYGVFHVARVWPLNSDNASGNASGKPIIVEPNKAEPDAVANYGIAMRAFARDVAASRGLSAIQRGNSVLGAAVTFLLLMFPVVGFVAIATYINLDEGWRDWRGWAMGAVPVLAFGVLAIFVWRKQHPRAVDQLTDIERYLPLAG